MADRRTRLSSFLSLLFLIPLAACSCDEDPLTPSIPGTCEPTFDCPENLEYRLGECRSKRCQVDNDCCPGQKCTVAVGLCVDQYTACTNDAECTEIPGQTCIDFRDGRFCGYPNLGNALTEHGTQLCVTQADCERGRSCFGGRCVVYAPCEGGCREGEICDIDSNTCFALPTCTAQCGPGQILVVADPDEQSGPNCCKVDCACATLPPVLAGQFGWYSSLALPRDEIAVAAYDTIYGDLVVVYFDRMLEETKVEYVDGFPLDGPIVANPDGARGGRDTPGPNVGEHASMTIDPATNILHVAYYDRSEGRLKYANNSGGLWKISVVDEDGNVGLYTSIAMGPDGNPHIAYMMAEGTVPPDPMSRTGLKYASAHNNLPSSPSDWTIQMVDSKISPIPPCGGGCPSDQACIDGGGGPTCVPTVTGCMACDSNEACIDNAGTPSCETKVPLLPVDDLIDGTGLFASLAFTSTGTPVIAYYDRLDGDLRIAAGNAGGFTVGTLDGNDMMSPADVGQHANLAVGPGDVIGIAYFDATNDDLLYMQVGGMREVVDSGVTPPDLRLVGADASLIFDESGQPAIAYQDPTNIDLLFARRSGSPALWSTEVLRGAPPPGMDKGTASGFYASQKRDGAETFISSVDVTFDPEGNLLLTLSVLMKELL